MTGHETSLISRLCEAENPRKFLEWEGQDGYYVTTCRISADDVPGLIDIALKWSDVDWTPNPIPPRTDEEIASLLPVTAWRALADLQADAAVEPLLQLLRDCNDPYDEWLADDLPHFCSNIGEPAIQPLIPLAADPSLKEFVRTIALRSLGLVARNHPGTHERIVGCLTEIMAQAVEGHRTFNSLLLEELVDLGAVQAAEPIERAFSRNLIDHGMVGDWEQVRRDLGVEGLGLPMPNNPYDSMKSLRIWAGRELFSAGSLFESGEIDLPTAQAYYACAIAIFGQSDEGLQVIERHGNLCWTNSLLRFGVEYLGETVDDMTLDSVQEYVLDFVPRKVSADADAAAAILDELIQFWSYLNRAFEFKGAKSIVEWLSSDGLVARLRKKMSDPKNFGPAKSIVMAGRRLGYDMNSADEAQKFMKLYNQSVMAPQQPPNPAQKNRVGRNEPCPCGSGKKFKKCCGGPS